jgi:hypothetical protein
MSGRLSGKVCVITATGGSVGRATVLAFAREDASVAGCDLSVDAGAAQGPGVGELHAWQDVVGSSRPPGGSGERRTVSGLGREFLCDGRRRRGRWRDEGLVSTPVATCSRPNSSNERNGSSRPLARRDAALRRPACWGERDLALWSKLAVGGQRIVGRLTWLTDWIVAPA